MWTNAAEYDLPAMLTAGQWELLEKNVTAFGPFEELTREVSSSSACAPDVILVINVVKCILGQENEANKGIKTMKNTLLEAVNSHFGPQNSVATLLDPRYKDK